MAADLRASLDEDVAVLRRTPATLAAMLEGLPEAWHDADEGPGTWSARVVLGHLIHGERTDWIPRARRILEHGERVPFEPFDREAQLSEPRASAAELLATLARERAASLAALEALRLGPRELELRGTHPAFGSVTLRELLATWVVHDLGHVAQIARVLAKRRASDVGPWRAYLPVLSDRTSGPAS